MLKNRDFTLYGKKFHLNDFRLDNYSARYELVCYNDNYDVWQRVFYCNTKKEAINRLKTDKWLYF